MPVNSSFPPQSDASLAEGAGMGGAVAYEKTTERCMVNLPGAQGVPPGYSPYYQQQPMPQVIYQPDPELYHQNLQLYRDNCHLTEKLKDKEARSNAYNEFIVNNHYTYTNGPNGTPLLLAEFSFARAIHVIPDNLCSQGEYVYLEFGGGRHPPMTLPYSSFTNDKTLITELEQHTNTSIRCRNTQKRSASLLRGAINEIMQKAHFHYFAGWMKVQDGMRFCTFGGLHTCQNGNSLQQLRYLEDTSGDVVLTGQAARTFVEPFLAIRNVEMRTLFFLIAHAGMLHSLLTELGFPIKAGLCLSCSGERVRTFCDSLLNLGDSHTAELALPEKEFRSQLIRSKDTIIRIREGRADPKNNKNATLLTDSITTGRIDDPKFGMQRLQGFPVLLSSETAPISYSSAWLSVDVMNNDIDWEKADMGIGSVGSWAESYLKGILHYFSLHVEDLTENLAAGKKWALSIADEDAPESAISTLGVCYGLWTLLMRYYSQEHIPVDVSEIVPPSVFPGMLAPIAELTDKAMLDNDIAEQFLEAIKKCLRKGTLSAVSWAEYQSENDSCVLYDRRFVYLPAATMAKVCWCLSYSRPTVIAALDADGLLDGKPISGTTKMTRKNNVRCFQLPRELFETFGEPSLFGGD